MQLIKYIFILFFCQTILSQEFHDTQGKLDITNSGQATFTLPIALPPSIQSVGPTINLLYVSGQSGGIAGQGWSINSISSITRIATRLDIDGFIDGVDFDDNDKLALDGQRLLLKSGTYWGDGSIYETEIQSNTKVQLMGSGITMYFIVTSPDGSRAWYGNYNGIQAVDLNSYYITRFEDANGNFIIYNYNLSSPNNTSVIHSLNTITIKEINFSANLNGNITPLNKIKFSYTVDSFAEKAYLKGTIVSKIDLLTKIEVETQNQLFKKYQITHYPVDTYGYFRVKKIQEYNGLLEPANPIEFEYNSTTPNMTLTKVRQSDYNEFDFGFKKGTIAGDIEGDGKLNLVWENKMSTGYNTDPYILPFTSDERKTMFIRTLDNTILDQKTLLLNIVENTNSLIFNVYKTNVPNGIGTGVSNLFSKAIAINNSTVYNSSLNTSVDLGYNVPNPELPDNCEDSSPIKNSNTYLNGDFNGDGISEILFFNQTNENFYFSRQRGHQNILNAWFGCEKKYNFDNMELYLLDMNPNNSSTLGEKGFVKINNLSFLSTILIDDKKYVQDFNGDGKDDMLIVKRDHSYKVISFKQLLTAPWVEAEIIGQGTFYFSFYEKRPLYFGDFNGDGKIDMIHPNVTGVGCEDHDYCFLWHIYYSNPKLDNGDFFEIETKPITAYMPERHYDVNNYYNNYIVMDTNKDGKSDLVRIEADSYRDECFWCGSHPYNNSFRVYSFAKKPNGNFVQDYISDFMTDNESNDNFVYPISPQLKYNNLNYDLLLFRNGSPAQGNEKIYVNFTKNTIKDNSLLKVTQSGGSIVDEIVYEPMIAGTIGSTFINYNTPLAYPLIKIKEVPNALLISKIKNTSLGVSKFQDFVYSDFIINLGGIGTLGFKKTARTNWYLSSNEKKMWSATENDPIKRNSKIWSYTEIRNSDTPFNFASPYSQGLLTKIENTYTSPIIDPISKRYTLLLDKQKSTDLLTNVINETSYHYTTDGYFLPDIVTSKNYEDVKLQSTKITETSFDSSITGVGNSYYIGRPTSSNTIITAYDDTKTSSEKYYYNNGNVIKAEKTKGNNHVVLVEDMNYFPNGNLKDKTISATGTTGVDNVSPRKTSYTYDASNRYVKTTITPDGIETINNGFDELYGLVKSQTNTTFNQTISNEYDAWGKTSSVTDYLGKSITYSYERNGDEYITKVYPESGGESFTVSDALARVIRKGHLDLSGRMVLQDTKYDELGRKSEESEPYFEGDEPQQWSYLTYDDLSRIIQLKEFTGKITTYEYDGLIVKTDDGVLKKEIAKNANGDLMTSTDTPGGIIHYEYDAEGKLLKSIYDNTEMTIIYDAWGRKIEMNDPSGGIYKYKYNAYGELLEEETLKGYTRNRYDAIGKLLSKQVIGKTVEDRTNIFNVYTYDPIYKWLTKIDVTNEFDGNSVYEYSYDIGSGSTETKQLKKTVENIFNPQQTYTKELTFDDFGRVETETSTVAAYGKSSIKTVFNKYMLNELFQIRDTNEQGALLWEAIKFNARGQLMNSILGNTTAISKTYDISGNPDIISHSIPNHDPFMTLQNSFDLYTNNLSWRMNSLFNTTEEFIYDELNRLTGWSNDFKIYQNCKFNSGVEGFISNGGYMSNEQGVLKVKFDYTNGITKKIVSNAAIGEMITIKFDCLITNFDCHSYTPFLCNNSILHVKIYEKDPLTNTISHSLDYIIDDGLFDYYTITNYGDVYIYFYAVAIDPNEDRVVLNFNLDNLLVNTYKEFTQDYSDSGKITKNELGEYRYTNPEHPYQNNTIKLTDDALSYYTPIGRQDIKYNAFKCPISIAQANERIDFGYNGMQQRNTMYYGSTAINPIDRPTRKHYSADGTMEIKYTKPNGSIPEQVEFIIYIGGDAYSAPLLAKSNGGTGENYYLHRDYLGSIIAITNNEGAIVEKRQFDAWGNIVNVEDGTGTTLDKLTFIDRGYTGHEHLQGVGLINMNARLYDPKLHRLLQADNFIQDPTSTQDYNRYSYAHNNPLKYVDIDGNNPILIGALIAVASYLFISAVNHQPIDIIGIASSAFIGGFSGAITFGIGSVTSTINSFVLRASVQAAAHGLFQGGITSVQGGKFWNGFASGCLSSLAASAWSGGNTPNGKTCHWNGIGGKFAQTGAGMITFGTIAGGVGSSLTGGNFWQGAVTGLMVSGLNHLAHQTKQPQPKRPDADGKLTLEEANEWWANGNGDLTVDASKVDLNFIDPSKMVKGQKYLVQSLTTSKDGRVYGRIWVEYQGNNQVSIDPDTYDFNQEGSFWDNPGRNTANAIGKFFAGEGTPYQINFRGLNTIKYSPPPVSTYHQTSHGFRF